MHCNIVCAVKTTRECPMHDYRVRHFNDFMKSLNDIDDDDFELILGYYESDDIEYDVDFPVRIINVDGFYNASVVNTAAAKAAKDGIIFFADLDFIMPQNTMETLRLHVKSNQCFFPIWWSENEETTREIQRKRSENIGNKEYESDSQYGRWRTTSYGALGITVEDFAKIGSYMKPDIAKTWGGDAITHQMAIDAGINVVRIKWPELVHQWHPTQYNNFYHEPDK